MARRINKVAVLGAGTMGGGIACQVANAGLPCVLLDIVPPKLSDEERKDKKNRDRFAASTMAAAAKAKKPPAMPLYTGRFAKRVTTGNFEDDFDLLKDCDLIVEAVVEDLKIKRDLFARVAEVRKPDAIVATNTSGLSLASITEGFDESFRKHFLVMHFFNPVRFLRLLEIVRGPDTDDEVVEAAAEFGARELGKGIVYAKDTPNFIANRIGVAGIAKTFQLMDKHELTVEEVDIATGPAMGRPKTGTYGTTDLVGLDVLAHILKNTYEVLPDDPARDLLVAPEWYTKMVEGGQLGKKAKKGFYKREGKTKYYWDHRAGEYKEMEKPKFKSIKASKDAKTPDKSFKALLGGDDKIAKFAWDSLSSAFQYVDAVHAEIADDIVNIDNAMKWGFNWELGPFQVWDAVGVKESVERMKAEGLDVPQLATDVLEKGEGSFYVKRGAEPYYWDFKAKDYKPVPAPAGKIDLAYLKDTGKTIKENDSASLVDIGDGVLCLEFHSKMNALDDDIIRMMLESVDIVESKADYAGLVIGNDDKTAYSAGANIFMMLMLARQKKFDLLEEAVSGLQQAIKRLKYSDKPVVAAPHGLALGGGCEVVLGCDAAVASSELYMGLVELGAGVIPAGCGTTNTLIRWLEHIPPDMDVDRFPYIQKAFECIGMAKVSFSAEQARENKHLRLTDRVVTNRDDLINEAKKLVLGMAAAGYRSPHPPECLVLPGREGLATFKMGLHNMLLGGFVTEYEQFMGTKLANIMCGGDIEPGTQVTEDHLHELEREAILSLFGEVKTQERMQAILMTGKPLRN